MSVGLDWLFSLFWSSVVAKSLLFLIQPQLNRFSEQLAQTRSKTEDDPDAPKRSIADIGRKIAVTQENPFIFTASRPRSTDERGRRHCG